MSERHGGVGVLVSDGCHVCGGKGGEKGREFGWNMSPSASLSKMFPMKKMLISAVKIFC